LTPSLALSTIFLLLEIRRKARVRKEQEHDSGVRGVRAEQLLHLEPNNFLPQDGGQQDK
jgi:hypothetical protein